MSMNVEQNSSFVLTHVSNSPIILILPVIAKKSYVSRLIDTAQLFFKPKRFQIYIFKNVPLFLINNYEI